MTLENALKRYVGLISRSRLISAPEIGDIKGEDDYRDTLVACFTEIGEISGETKKLLDENIYPLLNGDEPLTAEQESLLNDFSKELVNTTTISYLDPVLCYKIAFRLLSNAEREKDDRLLIRAIDKVVDSSYIMMALARRLSPCSDIAFEYRRSGLEASKRLLGYLDEELFASLPDDECKEIVLVNSRYINAIEFSGRNMDDHERREMFRHLDDSLKLEARNCYREALPDYDWELHRFRIYQYFISCTEMNNVCGLSRDEIGKVFEAYENLEDMWQADEKRYSAICPRSTMDLYAARVSYLSGHIDTEEYKSRLRRIHEGADPGDYGLHGIIANNFVLVEYLLVAGEAGLSDEDNKCLAHYYLRLAAYLQRMPKTGSIIFATTYMSEIIRHFVDVPDHSFRELCINLLVAMHPPTYVHTLTMSSIVVCLTSHLIRKEPGLFVDFANCSTPEEVKEKEEDILAYARRASQAHDIGKLFVIEFIIMYARSLFEEEFQMIRRHSDIGAYVLSMHDNLKDCRAVTVGHHFRFEELETKASEGLFDRGAVPFIAAASCADALDAATDAVGRSYKRSKPLEMVIEELREDSGRIYAPYVVDLFEDPDVVEDVRKILTEGREDNYRRTYENLAEIAAFTD